MKKKESLRPRRTTVSMSHRVNSYSIKKKSSTIPIDQINQYIRQSYHSNQWWSQHLVIFYDLFSTLELAIQKSKTYSLTITCKWLHDEMGCSYEHLYRALTSQIAGYKLDQLNELLDISSKSGFQNSVESLQIVGNQ